MPTLNLLYQKRYKINESITIVIPSVGDIIENEDEYYGMVSLLTAMPIDLMVQLDNAGIDFTSISEYELFLSLFSGLKGQDTSLIFENLNPSDFEVAVEESTGKVVLLDKTHDVKIDRAVHGQIVAVLRKIHHLEKNRRKPANEEAKEYMLKRAREKMQRNKNRKSDSQLESLIVAMVNTEQYKYDFEGTKELSIYQFNESVRQVIKKVDYDNRMYGVYAGTINAKELSQDDLNWLVHK
jgi:hypothetical protein